MRKLISRKEERFIKENLEVFPSVEILGPRQCGKSTLSKMLSDSFTSFFYLDLQNRDDLAKLNEPDLFLLPMKIKQFALMKFSASPSSFQLYKMILAGNRKCKT